MAVTDGAYVTEEEILDLLGHRAGTVFGASTTPTDAEVSRAIVDAEQVMDARLAGAGFTVPATGAAGADCIGYLAAVAAHYVAAWVLDYVVPASGPSRSEGGPLRGAPLRTRADEMMAAVVGSLDGTVRGDVGILVDAGLTSGFTAATASHYETWQTRNSSEAEATTPVFSVGMDW